MRRGRAARLIASCDGQWAGLSLTMPLKRAVLPLLDRTEPLAVEAGGANTVVFAGGERHGYNTDVPGMVAALAEAGVTAPPGATILGAGATACAASPPSARSAWSPRWSSSVTGPGPATCWPPRGRLGMEVALRPFDSEVRDGDLPVSTVASRCRRHYAERAWGSRPGPAAVLDVVYAPWPTPSPRRPPVRCHRGQRPRPAAARRLPARSS